MSGKEIIELVHFGTAPPPTQDDAKSDTGQPIKTNAYVGVVDQPRQRIEHALRTHEE